MGIKLGRNSVVYSSIKVARELKITIGAESFIGSQSVFTGGTGSSVMIGNYCDISDCVHFVTGTHEIDASGNRVAGKGYSKDIRVGNGVWIGYKAVLLPGVSIGDKVIIGAGTVVHKDVPSRTVVAGNPMKTIRNV
jgi:maltose O-acetyltransferase